MKTKTVSKKKDVKEPVIIKVNTLQDAKEKIYSEIQEGKNFREIVQTKFDIQGIIKSFNISQINQIKGEFEPKITQNRLDPDKSEVFKMFNNGHSPTDVIIKKKYDYDFVKQSWEEYAEINGKQLIPKSTLRRIRDILKPIGYAQSYSDLEDFIRTAIDGYWESKKLTYPCCKCYADVHMSEKSLEAAREFLSTKWGHSECVN